MELTKGQQTALNDLAWSWDSAYVIKFDGETYVATRANNPAHILTADTVGDLRELIRADYVRWHGPMVERSSL